MQATLVMFKADGERREFPLAKSETVVGRKSTCDLRIPLSSVSRQHFKLLVDNDTVKLRDLGSSNGTYYNDERVLEADLEPGDQIRVGPVTFIVTIDGEPSEIDVIKTVLPQDTGEIESLDVSAAAEEAPEAIEDDAPLPPRVDDESHTPTVDIDEDDDDDPIAALEALAMADGDDDDDDVVIPMIDDDEDEETTKK